jgi:hypothetical protein
MNKKVKHLYLFFLAITAAFFAKAVLILFNDPEGSNLLVTVCFSLFVFFISLIAYKLPISTMRKFTFAVSLQIVLVVLCYFVLR